MIFITRFLRIINRDIYVPEKCNAKYYNILFKKNCYCDCKSFCKYPPPGKPVIIQIHN